jgi:RNA polymerase sigma-70 factor (ECF subfamily)
MHNEADKALENINQLYRGQYSKMLASLLYFFPDVGLETAEDIIQDAFTAALAVWRNDGVPSNPAGWIFAVCKNKALNKLKATKKTRGLFENEDFDVPETDFSDSFFKDRQLRLLFACANPDLPPKVQVVITLKYIAGLKIEAIAKILGMTIDGVDKLLSRARQKIRHEKILLEEPEVTALKHRLPVVHKIIYLIFNEGYKSSWGNEIIREGLCEDALLMNQVLRESGLGDNETEALHALMMFNAARFEARFGPEGELLDLEEQDRTLWNKELIALACWYLKQSSGSALSTYHYEASIACVHCTATSFQTTNWAVISALYVRLLQINPNPFVELNYAITLYYSGQKQKAFGLLNTLQGHPFLHQYYLLNAALGKLHLLEGSYDQAKGFFIKTLEQTSFKVEKDFVMKMIRKVDEGEKF